MRLYICTVALCLTVASHGAIILDQQGQLGPGSERMQSGEWLAQFPLPVAEGDFITVRCEANGFNPYLIIALEDGRRFERPGAELTFLGIVTGNAQVTVTTIEPGEQGAYSLQVEALPVRGELGGLEQLLQESGQLAAGDTVLESGEYADVYELPVEAGRGVVALLQADDFDAYLIAQMPDGDLIDADDVSGTNSQVAWLSGDDGTARLVVTSSAAGETGAYELVAYTGDLDYTAAGPPPAATPVAPPATPPVTGGVVTPDGRPVPPAPKFEGNAPLDITNSTWRTPPLQPTSAATEPLSSILHRMNYVEVQLWGFVHASDTGRPGEADQWPKPWGWDIDNYLSGFAAGPPAKSPLTWTGNVFSAYHLQMEGAGRHTYEINVTGRVSPDGDRIEWVLFRYFEQGVYHDRDSGDNLLSLQEWRSLGFVDLQINNPNWEAWGDPRLGTMASVRAGRSDDMVVRDGLNYGWRNHVDAGKHVMEAAFVRREPTGRNDSFISIDGAHWLSYKSADWLNAETPPTAMLRFEYNPKLDP